MAEPSRLSRLFYKTGGREWGTNLDDYDPEVVGRVREQLRSFFGPGKYFPTEFEGWENVPNTPVMVVANHSGGLMIPDCWALGLAWYERFGVERPLHPMAHEMVFSTPLTAKPFAKMGVLRASRSRALEVLGEWKRDLIVFPGGDLDTFRPYSQRYKVQFAGRTGYARIALKAGVPIVPVAHAGSHETLIVLTDGNSLARKMGLHDLARADIWPISLSLPWGISFGPLPHFPLPTKLRFKVGKPVELPGRVLPGAEPPQEMVDEYDERVRRAMQGLLDQLRDEAPSLKTRARARLHRLHDGARRAARDWLAPETPELEEVAAAAK
jgi:1-acyl-sn-glycerol-3-phosphate acyltransferase